MKNNEKLLDAIGEVNEDKVPDAPERKPKTLWIKLSAVGCGVAAAALLGIVILGGGMREQPPSQFGGGSGDITHAGYEQQTGETTEKPLDPINANTSIAITDDSEQPPEATTSIALAEIYPDYDWEKKEGDLEPITPSLGNLGMGFEGITVDDPSELQKEKSANPWTEDMNFGQLPVFHNAASDNWVSRTGIVIHLSEEEMTRMAKTVASMLDTEAVTLKTEYGEYIEYDGDYPTQEQFESAQMMPVSVTAQCADDTEIVVYGGGNIRIEFGHIVQLPLDTVEKWDKAGADVADKYKKLLQYENPAFFEDSGYQCVYDKSGSVLEQILNYNFKITRFCINEEGVLWLVWMDNAFCTAEYLGDYPVITLDEAQEMLLDGKYITTVPDDFIKEGGISADDILVGKLVYRGGASEKYFMPYYRFHVELKDSEYMGEGYHYGAFYVPAVSEEYLSDLTVWDGHFN